MRHPRQIAYECCCALSSDAPLVDRLWQCQRAFEKLQPENTPAHLLPVVRRYRLRLKNYAQLTVIERENLARDILVRYWGEMCEGRVCG